jgi:hypothetical protein
MFVLLSVSPSLPKIKPCLKELFKELKKIIKHSFKKLGYNHIKLLLLLCLMESNTLIIVNIPIKICLIFLDNLILLMVFVKNNTSSPNKNNPPTTSNKTKSKMIV